MNAYDLHKYWIAKYEDTFNEQYQSDKIKIEPFLLKRLLTTYNKYLLLEAIDIFFKNIKKEKASLLLFSSNKFFPEYFKNLIKEKDTIQYQRMLPWYSEENQTKIRKLLQLYGNYLYALSLCQEEIDEMQSIRENLKDIPMENI